VEKCPEILRRHRVPKAAQISEDMYNNLYTADRIHLGRLGCPSQTDALKDRGSITACANQSLWRVMVMFPSSKTRLGTVCRASRVVASRCLSVTRDGQILREKWRTNRPTVGCRDHRR
jgi:hypothetical protein